MFIQAPSAAHHPPPPLITEAQVPDIILNIQYTIKIAYSVQIRKLDTQDSKRRVEEEEEGEMSMYGTASPLCLSKPPSIPPKIIVHAQIAKATEIT